jgi:hypothetical protein
MSCCCTLPAPKTEATTAWRPTCVALANPANPKPPVAYRAKHLVQDLVALICGGVHHGDRGMPGRARLGRRRGLEPGQPAAAMADEAPGDHQLAPPRRVFARTANTTPPSRPPASTCIFCADQTLNRCWPKNDFQRLFAFFNTPEGHAPAWLTEAVRAQYRACGSQGLTGACNYYRASPLRPPREGDPGAAGPVTLPDIDADRGCAHAGAVGHGRPRPAARPAGRPAGLGAASCSCGSVAAGASHWIVHEHPERVVRALGEFLLTS